MATIVHFDIGADNPERAKKFYEALFGWKIGTMPGFPGYYEIETTDLNNARGVGGGLTKREIHSKAVLPILSEFLLLTNPL